MNTLSLKIIPHVVVVVRSWGTSLGASPINLYFHYMCVQNTLYPVYNMWLKTLQEYDVLFEERHIVQVVSNTTMNCPNSQIGRASSLHIHLPGKQLRKLWLCLRSLHVHNGAIKVLCTALYTWVLGTALYEKLLLLAGSLAVLYFLGRLHIWEA